MKEKVLFSLSLLIIFIYLIETNQSVAVVCIFAYLFLVSILPLLIDFFKAIFKSSISDLNFLEESYVYKNDNIKFNWSSNSYTRRGNSLYFKNINNGIFFTKDDISSYKLVKLIMDNDNSALKLVFIDNNNIQSFEINDSTMLLCPKLTRQSNIELLFEKILEIINHRYDLLVKKGLNHYLKYNKVSRDMKEVLITISEIKDIVDDQNLCNMLIRILLNGYKVGIKVLMFTCYNNSDFDFQKFGDLVTVYNEFDETNILNELKFHEVGR